MNHQDCKSEQWGILLSSDIKTSLESLSRKELVRLAEMKRIKIPQNWSKSLIVELLALNASIDDIPNAETEPLAYETMSDGTPIIV